MADDAVFSDLQMDMLKEAFNLGIGRAASALSKMINQEILLSVPDVQLHTSDEFMSSTSGHDSIVSVVQQIKEPFDGKSILLFPENSSLEVVRRMLKMEDSNSIQSVLHEEAVTEIGNIILNACVGAVAKAINTQISMELPQFRVVHQEQLLDEYNIDKKDTLLVVNMNMTLQDSDVSGYLVFLFGYSALQNLRDAVHETLVNITNR